MHGYVFGRGAQVISMLGTCMWKVLEGSWDPLNTSVGYTIDSSVEHSVRQSGMVSVCRALRSARRALVKDRLSKGSPQSDSWRHPVGFHNH